jgi:hypothetical protein
MFESLASDGRAVSGSDIADYNPSSSAIRAATVSWPGCYAKYPIRWTKSSIEIGERRFTAADHVPVLI